VRTNSDLYQALTSIGAAAPAGRSLAEYLRGFWFLAHDHGGQSGLAASTFVGLLAAALAGGPAFEPAWSREDLRVPAGTDPFTAWSRTVRAQVCDLRELAADGLYRNRSRHRGVMAPRPHGSGARSTPARWVNFEIGSYLESGAVGAFGGWRPEFEGARVDVPPPEPTPVEHLTWHDLARFAVCGQLRE
jgi:hypothetical protein